MCISDQSSSILEITSFMNSYNSVLKPDCLSESTSMHMLSQFSEQIQNTINTEEFTGREAMKW